MNTQSRAFKIAAATARLTLSVGGACLVLLQEILIAGASESKPPEKDPLFEMNPKYTSRGLEYGSSDDGIRARPWS